MSDKSAGADGGLTYAQSGVDIDAGNALVKKIAPFVKATARAGADSDIGGFGGLFDLKAAGFVDPILVAANDGVGTKLKIAIETGIHDTVGIDLVAMCVNDLIVQGAEPLFFLDYFACGRLDVDAAASIVEGIAKGCTMSGSALIGGETAEMPGMYADGDYDLAGFSVGAVERGGLLPRPDIGPGDVILGLASNGVHSNGFSLVRRIREASGLTWTDTAPFDETRTLGRALLEPTRIYVKPLLATLKQTAGIKALAHITGGGLPENLPRVLPKTATARIDLGALPDLPVFKWLAATGNVAEPEMLRTFNCGVGMVVVVAADAADAVVRTLEGEGETVVRLGMMSDRADEAVIFDGKTGFSA